MERQRNRPHLPQESGFEDEHILEGYITRLLNMQDAAQEDWLTEDDLKRAATDMGLTEREMERIEAAAEAHRQRGQQFLTHKSWDEAVSEFSQAMALTPFNTTVFHGLAQAHRERWWTTGNAEDRDEAERYARRTIQIDPDHTASYELLKDLQRTPIRATERGRPTRTKGIVFMLVLFAVVAVVLGLLAFLVLLV